MSGQGKAAGVIGSSVPVRPAGLLVAKDRLGQLPMPIPGLVSSDHSPDPSLGVYSLLPLTCPCLSSPPSPTLVEREGRGAPGTVCVHTGVSAQGHVCLEGARGGLTPTPQP